MSTGQIIAALFLLGVIGLAVYRGVWEPIVQKKKNRTNKPEISKGTT
jgi:hypothetical protein